MGSNCAVCSTYVEHTVGLYFRHTVTAPFVDVAKSHSVWGGSEKNICVRADDSLHSVTLYNEKPPTDSLLGVASEQCSIFTSLYTPQRTPT